MSERNTGKSSGNRCISSMITVLSSILFKYKEASVSLRASSGYSKSIYSTSFVMSTAIFLANVVLPTCLGPSKATVGK